MRKSMVVSVIGSQTGCVYKMATLMIKNIRRSIIITAIFRMSSLPGQVECK